MSRVQPSTLFGLLHGALQACSWADGKLNGRPIGNMRDQNA